LLGLHKVSDQANLMEFFRRAPNEGLREQGQEGPGIGVTSMQILYDIFMVVFLQHREGLQEGGGLQGMKPCSARVHSGAGLGNER
jgi:hypothetical protein